LEAFVLRITPQVSVPKTQTGAAFSDILENKKKKQSNSEKEF
jgi:hypothetical protein